MPQKFYLRNETFSGGGTMPTGEQGAGTPTLTWTGATTLRQLTAGIGSSQSSQAQLAASGTGTQRHFIRFFASEPLKAGTYGSGTWTFNIADSENNAASNFWTNLVNVYFWRPSTGAKVGTVIDGSNGTTQGGSEPTSASSEQVTRWTFTGSNVTIQDGDVLVLEVWAVNAQGTSTARTNTVYYGGSTENDTENATVSNHAAFLSAPGNIPPVSIPLEAAISCPATVAADLTAPKAVERDAGFPKTAHQTFGTGSSLATAAFDVPAGGRLLVAVAGWLSGDTGDPGVPSITDNQGTHLNWTAVGHSYWTDAYWPAYLRMWVADAPDAITGLTVTTTVASGGNRIGILSVDCLKGPGTVGNVVGASAARQDVGDPGAALSVTLSAEAGGSWIAGIFATGDTSTALTADGNTTNDDHQEDGSVGCAVMVGHKTDLTTGAGSYTVGTTYASNPYPLWVVAELKKYTAPAAQLEAAVACSATVAGALTTAITLAAAVACSSTVSATLAGSPAALEAAVACGATLSADLTVVAGLAAAVATGATIGAWLEDERPVISPASGVYTSGRTVSISKVGGGTIRYTTDGSRPTAASTAYTGTFSVSSTGIVRATIFRADGGESPMATAWYAIESTGTKIGPDHVVRTDGDSKLISWLPQEIAYGELIKRVARSLITMPLDTDAGHGSGYPRFLFHSYLNADLSPAGGWPSAPGGQIGMLLDAVIQAYPYTGDASMMAMAKMLLAYLIKNGSTPASGSWQGAIYNEADPDESPFIGAGDNYGNPGVGDGQGNLEPDKQAEIGWGALQLWMHDPTQTDFRDLAIRLADQLCANRKTSTSQTVSPWPFRTTQATNSRPSGAGAGEDYCDNIAPYFRLFDDLIRLGLGSTSNYQTARDALWTWATTYPLSGGGSAGPWAHYFEDQPWAATYNADANSLNGNQMARLLMERPSMTSNYLTWASAIVAWVETNYLASGGAVYGALPIEEQDWYQYEMGSHTSRFGMVHALIYAANQSATNKDKAYRALNWTTYMNRTDGYSLDGYPSPNQVWMTDGFGDTIRHFAVAMYAVPEWAPPAEDHLLGSTSVVQSVRYSVNRVDYQVFDAAARETLRLSFAPTAVRAGASWLSQRSDLNAEGWVWDGTAKVLKVRHDSSGQIAVMQAAELAAAVTCSSTVTASLGIQAALEAAIVAGATVGATLTTQIALAASVTAGATLVGALTTQIALAGSIATGATVSASLTTQIRLVAAVACGSTVAAALTSEIRLAGAVACSSTLAADITTAIRFQAAIACAATLSAEFAGGAAALQAAVSSGATLGAALTTQIRLAAAVTSGATVSATLGSMAQLQAAVVATATLTADLTAFPASLQANVACQTALTAALTTAIRFQAGVTCSSALSAELFTDRLIGVRVRVFDASPVVSVYGTSAKASLQDLAVQAELMNRST